MGADLLWRGLTSPKFVRANPFGLRDLSRRRRLGGQFFSLRVIKPPGLTAL